jgi:hypothetical protein
VARRHVDDQPPDIAVADRFQLCGADFVMPAQRELGPGLSSRKECCTKLAKSARSNASYSPGLWVSAVVIALPECGKIFSNL